MNQIQGGRWDTFLRRFFSLKQGAVSPELDATIQPVMPVAYFGAELFALLGDRLYNASTFQAAVAAQRTWFQLRNGAGSGVLGVLEGSAAPFGGFYQFWTSVTIDFAAYLLPIAATWGAGTLDASARLDARISTPASLELYHGTSAVALPTTAEQVASGRFFANNTTDLRIPPVVIPPGFMLMVANITVNVAANINVCWRERPAEQSELRAL